MSCLYILEINPLSVVSFAIIFLPFWGLSFHLAYSFLCCAKAFKFNQVPLIYLCFYFCYSRRWVIEDLALIYVIMCSAYVFLMTMILKIMASGPITSWEIDGETVETVADFIFLGSKITADGDCSYEIKRHLLLGRKVMTNLDHILKSRDITLSTKVGLVKATVFPVVMYGCESWTIKNAELRGTDAFELWCWRRLLRVPWTARKSNQSILGDQSWVFIERTDIEAETLILWPPDVKSSLIWKDPDAGKDWGQEEKGTTDDEMAEWHHWLNGHEFG